MPHLKPFQAHFPADCTATTMAGGQVTIPRGIHHATKIQTGGGGVHIVFDGSTVELPTAEWFRLQKEGKARRVP